MEKVTGYVTGVNGNLVSARFSGSEMCIRDRISTVLQTGQCVGTTVNDNMGGMY